MLSRLAGGALRVRHLSTTPTPVVIKNAEGVAAAPRAVGYWLVGCAGMVFGMVALGGATRLTKSGLSMVEWKPHSFTKPSTPEEWAEEFAKYKQYPEYKRVNQGMSLEDFKFIYMMEWGHRQWGRLIGLAFVGPAVYFAARGMIPPSLRLRVLAMLGLGGAQGAVGWWMVKSGLEEDLLHNRQQPRVSPYRLAAHLGMAFSVYSLLLWTGLDVLCASPAAIASSSPALSPAALSSLKRLKPIAAATTAVVVLTVASGAFVAGLDAGHAYNDWPLFAGRLIPELIWDDKLGLRNFTENVATVQFDHRNLAYLTLASAATLMIVAKRGGGLAVLPREVRKALHSVTGMAGTQAALGISTLMLYVPVPLATVHQAGSMALLSFTIWCFHAIRRHITAAAIQAAKRA